MSVSNADSTSSGSTSGALFSTGIVPPSGTGWPRPPGSSSMNMSFRPVRGRSRPVASVLTWILFQNFGSISVLTSATPLRGRTATILPTCTPATRTDWPCPGVTAWASENSKFSVFGFGSSSGIAGRASWL